MTTGVDLLEALSVAVHPIAVMQRITDETLALIEPAQGVMVGVVEGDGVTYVTGAGNQVALVGTHVKTGASLTGVALRTGRVQVSPDVEDDPRVDLEACRRHSVRSLVCVPLRHEGESIGVLAVNCPVPNVFGADEVDALTRLADFVATSIASARSVHAVSTELLELSAASGRAAGEPDDGGGQAGAASRYLMNVLDPGAARRREAGERVERVLRRPELLSMVFQPVVDLEADRIIAYEALARFEVEPYRPPHEWFAEAHACDLGVELELLAVERALGGMTRLPAEAALTLNVGPRAARTDRFAEAFAGVAMERVIVELTEHAVVDDYSELVASLRDLRRNGVRIAIDDTGSGYSSLAHILRIAPDFIKLDIELTRGIDLDPVRRALAAALVAFAADTGAQIVAEGVETADELAVLRRLGVRFAQGYHLGRPAPR